MHTNVLKATLFFFLIILTISIYTCIVGLWYIFLYSKHNRVYKCMLEKKYSNESECEWEWGEWRFKMAYSLEYLHIEKYIYFAILVFFLKNLKT